MGSLGAAHKVVFGRDIKLTSRLQTAQFVPIIRSLMIISTLRASPLGPLFLFWAIASISKQHRVATSRERGGEQRSIARALHWRDRVGR